MLTVHHLRKSQSERVVFLCEELELGYDLQTYDRDPATMAAPPAYKALHPLGAAPVITEGDLTLAESEAVVAYILGRHGDGRLMVGAEHSAYPDYLYWFAFVNGTLQPALSRNSLLRRSGLGDDNVVLQAMEERAANMLRLADARAAAVEWLAGEGLYRSGRHDDIHVDDDALLRAVRAGALRRPARLRASNRRTACLSAGHGRGRSRYEIAARLDRRVRWGPRRAYGAGPSHILSRRPVCAA